MKIIPAFLLFVILIGCDGGLAPPEHINPGFGGTVYVAPGSWPPKDSVVSLWVFASLLYPLDSAKVYNGLMGNPPSIFLYPGINISLPLDFDSLTYSFPVDAGTYKYVGVIQQVNASFSTVGIRAFRVVGVYKDPADSLQPGNVVVDNITRVNGINIHVDFHNPPPQPF